MHQQNGGTKERIIKSFAQFEFFWVRRENYLTSDPCPNLPGNVYAHKPGIYQAPDPCPAEVGGRICKHIDSNNLFKNGKNFHFCRYMGKDSMSTLQVAACHSRSTLPLGLAIFSHITADSLLNFTRDFLKPYPTICAFRPNTRKIQRMVFMFLKYRLQ